MAPSFTVITPSYNSNTYVEQALNSVMAQTHKDIQYIVIDGFSNDKTQRTLRRYEQNFSHLIIERDSGQSEAINKGLKLAKGDVINWLNTDDYYEPDALRVVGKFFENQAIRVVAGKSRLFQGDQTVRYSRGTDIYPGNLIKTIGWARIDQPETFFRKEAWDRVGLLNEQLHYTMDREWWMRYLYHFGLEGIIKIDDVLVNFRLHEHSKTVSATAKFKEEHDTLFYILATILKDNNIERLLLSNLTLDQNIDSEIRHWTNKEIIQGSLCYYLLNRAEELYYQGEHGCCRDFLRFVNPEALESEDRHLLNKIKIRSRLPHSIIRLFRKK